MAKQKRDFFQQITNQIIEQLESGNIPWLKPWKNGKNADPSMPYNAATKRAYNGVNVLILWGSQYSSNGWVTFKQALDLGGKVKKGEKGTSIAFWKFLNKKEADGNESSFPILRTYTVFNIEQCEGLKLPKIEAIITEKTTALNLALSNDAVVNHVGNKAFFVPSKDYISMPPQKNFDSNAHYDSVLLHELTHWSGHKNRLDRDFSGRFGTESYAFEELVAEMGSAFLASSLGVTECTLQNTAYIKTWLKVLKNDKKAIFTAASKSKQATEFLLEAVEHVDISSAA